MHKSIVPLFFISLAIAGQSAAQEVTVVFDGAEMPENLSVRSGAHRIELEESDDGWTGNVSIGGKDLPVLATPTAEGKPAQLIVGERELTCKAGVNQRGGTVWEVGKSVEVDGAEVRVDLLARGTGRDGALHVIVMCSSAPLYAKVEVAGTPMHLAMLDADTDGKFGGSGDRWLLLTDAQLAEFNDGSRGGTKGFRNHSMPRADHPVFLSADKAVFIENVVGNEAKLVVKKPEHGRSHYLHQRAADINAAYGRDLSQYDEGRPTAAKPIDWFYCVDLAEPLARAKKLNKPLFVDFETDWCGWCHVLDKVTYPDKEVAAFLSKNFIPVKLNVELDPKGTSQKYGVRGFPGMVVILPDGTKADSISGFSKASEFMEKLTKLAESAAKAMQQQ